MLAPVPIFALCMAAAVVFPVVWLYEKVRHVTAREGRRKEKMNGIFYTHADSISGFDLIVKALRQDDHGRVKITSQPYANFEADDGEGPWVICVGDDKFAWFRTRADARYTLADARQSAKN
jgi:hypothetical protein